ncbi:ABC transporter ATP-binding protein [Candidatus Dependentiae bacterium]|nr:ABC transporter ATP-binding protein [Candidatus Dependentiae bacterium]
MNKPFLQVISVTKKYDNFEALKGISIQIEQGEVFTLLGVNGAGKTTLSSIIATLKPPTTGDILFNGNSIYKDISSYRRAIGFCPQRPNLNNYFSLRKNLEFAGRYFGMEDEHILSMIDELAERFDFKKYLDEKPEVLSGGYKQRFMLARTIIHSPKLIILDEPTVALDPHIRNQLWDYIKQLKEKNISILLTTHYLEEAEVLSDRVCVLEQGRIRLIDTPENLMRSFQKSNLEDVFIHMMQQD